MARQRLALAPVALAALALAACSKRSQPAASGSGSAAAAVAAGSASAGAPAATPVAKPAAPAVAAASVDDLWALAPPAPLGAAVVDGGTLTAVDRDLRMALPTMKLLTGGQAPSYAQVVQRLSGSATAASFADAGLDPARGLAAFAVDGGWVVVVPVTDHDRFVAARGGRVDAATGTDVFDDMTCAARHGLYACAPRPDLLAHLGAGTARIRDRWPTDLHGDVEAWMARDEIRAVAGRAWLDATGDAVAAVAAAHGSVTARLHVPGTWRGVLAGLAGHPARLDARGAGGFLALDLGALLPRLAAGAPPTPVAAGVTVRDLARAFDGTLQVIVPDGAADLEARAGLTRPAPIRTLVDHCPELLAGLGNVTATSGAGTCHLTVSPESTTIHVDVWVAGHELRAATHRHAFAPATGAPPYGPIGAELADGSWTATAWGHGSLFRDLGPNRPMPTFVRGFKDVVGGLMSLGELGFGVRIGRGGLTVLAHARATTADPDVQAALDDLLDARLEGASIDARADAIARRFPHSAFAADHRAGITGLLVPVAALGTAAAIVLPLLLDHLEPRPHP